MFTVECDFSDAIAYCDRNSRAVSEFAERAYRHLAKAVKDERSHHRFKNRTEAAEQSIAIHGRPTGGDLDVDVKFDVPYASYLVDKKWSRFRERVEAAQRAIEQDEVIRLAEAAQG